MATFLTGTSWRLQFAWNLKTSHSCAAGLLRGHTMLDEDNLGLESAIRFCESAKRLLERAHNSLELDDRLQPDVLNTVESLAQTCGEVITYLETEMRYRK
ncbi:hypothetical protein VT03_31685 [Planctomyces sp. SH-PL14]|nr:hypothetical protein VT03_31685 [Planctomyces sp. SH-PL14]